MNNSPEGLLRKSGDAEKEQDPNFINAKEKFGAEIKPGIDNYFPKLIAFTETILQTVERSGKTAVFIGRDGRWLFYLAKLLVDQEKNRSSDRLKFVDIGKDYIYPERDFSHGTSISAWKRKSEYEDYFKKLSIDINESFLVDVGFQGTILHDIREATGTKNNDDTLLVKSDLDLVPELKGFYQGKTSPEWDENINMGHFIEELPHIVLKVHELSPVRGGRLPKYKGMHDDRETFLAQMTYQYLKKSVGAFSKNRGDKTAAA